MPMSKAIDDMQTGKGQAEPVTLLQNMLKKDDDLVMKTEISRPAEMAALKTYALQCKAAGLNVSAMLIESILEWNMAYSVSHDRKSRTEVITALSEIFKAKNRASISVGETIFGSADKQ